MTFRDRGALRGEGPERAWYARGSRIALFGTWIVASVVACGGNEEPVGLDTPWCATTIGEEPMICPIGSTACENCLLIACASDAAACSQDPKARAANQRLLGCGCEAQVNGDAIGLTFELQVFGAAGDVEASALSCLQTACKDLCGI